MTLKMVPERTATVGKIYAR